MSGSNLKYKVDNNAFGDTTRQKGGLISYIPGVDCIFLSPIPKQDFSPIFLLIHMYEIFIYKS